MQLCTFWTKVLRLFTLTFNKKKKENNYVTLHFNSSAIDDDGLSDGSNKKKVLNLGFIDLMKKTMY